MYDPGARQKLLNIANELMVALVPWVPRSVKPEPPKLPMYPTEPSQPSPNISDKYMGYAAQVTHCEMDVEPLAATLVP